MDNENNYSLEEFSLDEKRKAIKTFSIANGSIVAYLLISTVAIYILQFVLLGIMGEERFLSFAEGPYFIWILQVLGVYAIAFPIFLLINKKLPCAQRESSSMSLREFGAIFLICEAIMFLGSLLSQWIVSFFEFILGHEIANVTSDLILDTPIWIIILIAVIIGPIFEELIFRKVMIDRLSIYGDKVAIITSAIGFGLFHGNFHQLFYATALGFVLGYVYTKTRRPIYTILLHILVNFMGTVPSMLLTDSVNRLKDLPADALIEGQTYIDLLLVNSYSFIYCGLAFAGLMIFTNATRNRLYSFTNECDIYVPVIHRARVYFLNFGTIAFLIYSIAQCILSLFIS